MSCAAKMAAQRDARKVVKRFVQLIQLLMHHPILCK